MALFPKSIDFFEQFDRALENVSRAANLLVDTFNNFSTLENFEKKAKAIYEFEQEGDMLTHDIMKDLNKTFLTPIDREDIHALASRIDDVLDLIWAAVDRMVVYRIDETDARGHLHRGGPPDDRRCAEKSAQGAAGKTVLSRAWNTASK